MSNVSIYGKKWIDLVFENRNQMYGAYQLRQENPKVTLLALFYGVLLFGGIVSALVLSSAWSNEAATATGVDFPDDYILHVSTYNPPATPEVPDAIKTTPANTVTKIVEQPINLLSNLTVVKTQQAVDVPTNKDAATIDTPAILGTVATLGIGTEAGTDSGKSNGSISNSGSGSTAGDVINKSTEVDKMPTYPGGIEKFYHYVATNFRKPEVESTTIVSVLVAFVVEKDGTLSNIRVIRNSGIAVDKEAIRLLSSMRTKWTPGFKNGEKVRTEFTLPIKVKFNE